MANRIHITTKGMKGMENDFGRLASPEPYEFAATRMDEAVQTIFEETQAIAPVGEGDERRPAGALRDSGQVHSEHEGDFWNAEIAYGTEDDELPYAVWARWKHHRNTGVDFMSPTEDRDDRIAEGMNSAFDEIFHGED